MRRLIHRSGPQNPSRSLRRFLRIDRKTARAQGECRRLGAQPEHPLPHPDRTPANFHCAERRGLKPWLRDGGLARFAETPPHPCVGKGFDEPFHLSLHTMQAVDTVVERRQSGALRRSTGDPGRVDGEGSVPDQASESLTPPKPWRPDSQG